jgi:hypothetical protein
VGEKAAHRNRPAQMLSLAVFNGTAAATPNFLIPVLVTGIQCVHVYGREKCMTAHHVHPKKESFHAADAAWLDSCDINRNEGGKGMRLIGNAEWWENHAPDQKCRGEESKLSTRPNQHNPARSTYAVLPSRK